MPIANKPENTEVPSKDQAESKEVAKKGPINGDDILDDMFIPDPSSPTPKDDKKDAPTEVPKDDKKFEEKTKETPAEEPFASIDGKSFKTKEELTAFVKSQIGYNSWLTGAVKKTHPEWFNSDGSIKTKDLEKATKEVKKEVEKATTTVEKGKETPADEMTPEQKDEIDKAKALLRKLGFISVDDDEFKNLRQTINDLKTEIDSTKIDEAKTIVSEFETRHPESTNHRESFANLIRERKYTDIEKAWGVFKIENEIDEKEVPIKKDDKSPESTLPSQVTRVSGKAPDKKPDGDFMDDILNAKGI